MTVEPTPLLVVETSKPKQLFLIRGNNEGLERNSLSYEQYVQQYKSVPIMYWVSEALLQFIPAGIALV